MLGVSNFKSGGPEFYFDDAQLSWTIARNLINDFQKFKENFKFKSSQRFSCSEKEFDNFATQVVFSLCLLKVYIQIHILFYLAQFFHVLIVNFLFFFLFSIMIVVFDTPWSFKSWWFQLRSLVGYSLLCGETCWAGVCQIQHGGKSSTRLSVTSHPHTQCLKCIFPVWSQLHSGYDVEYLKFIGYVLFCMRGHELTSLVWGTKIEKKCSCTG